MLVLQNSLWNYSNCSSTKGIVSFFSSIQFIFRSHPIVLVQLNQLYWMLIVFYTVSTFFGWPVGAQDSSLKLWDLRKLKNFKTITLDNNYEVDLHNVKEMKNTWQSYLWPVLLHSLKAWLIFLSSSCRWSLWSSTRVEHIWLLVDQT